MMDNNYKLLPPKTKEERYDEKNSHRYDDIITLPHPESKNHPKMSLHDRAAQFAPFAALTGLDSAMESTAKAHESQITEHEYD